MTVVKLKHISPRQIPNPDRPGYFYRLTFSCGHKTQIWNTTDLPKLGSTTDRCLGCLFQ